MIKGKAMRITSLKRERRVRVTQRDGDGNIVMEHSYPIAEGVAHIEYVVVDEYKPDMHRLDVYEDLAADIVLHA